MSSTKFDARQVISRDALSRLASAAGAELDDLLRSLNAETTPPMEMFASATPDLILNIGNISVQNPEKSNHRSLPFVNQTLPSFTSGTIEFPSTSGGTVTINPGSNSTLSIPSGHFAKVTIFIDESGDLGIIRGATAALAANATVAAPPLRAVAIGYVVMQNDSGTIQDVSNSAIFQFVSASMPVGSAVHKYAFDYTNLSTSNPEEAVTVFAPIRAGTSISSIQIKTNQAFDDGATLRVEINGDPVLENFDLTPAVANDQLASISYNQSPDWGTSWNIQVFVQSGSSDVSNISQGAFDVFVNYSENI
jgi:hypothetical protein